MSMYREIMNDIPMKLVKPKFTGKINNELVLSAETRAPKLIFTRVPKLVKPTREGMVPDPRSGAT